MSSDEAFAFERDTYFADSIALRRWDEEAKQEDVPVENIDALKAVVRRVLARSLRE